MTKDNFNRKKNQSNTKIIQLDPLSSRLSDAGHSGGASKGLKISHTKKIMKEVKPIIDKKNKTYRELNTSKNTKSLNKAQERLHTANEYRTYVTLRMKDKLPLEARKMLKKPFDKVIKGRQNIRNIFTQKLLKKDN